MVKNESRSWLLDLKDVDRACCLLTWLEIYYFRAIQVLWSSLKDTNRVIDPEILLFRFGNHI